ERGSDLAVERVEIGLRDAGDIGRDHREDGGGDQDDAARGFALQEAAQRRFDADRCLGDRLGCVFDSAHARPVALLLADAAVLWGGCRAAKPVPMANGQALPLGRPRPALALVAPRSGRLGRAWRGARAGACRFGVQRALCLPGRRLGADRDPRLAAAVLRGADRRDADLAADDADHRPRLRHRHLRPGRDPPRRLRAGRRRGGSRP
ncbi:hypothetical protein QU38_02645, partial [Staphylococcus aureus]